MSEADQDVTLCTQGYLLCSKETTFTGARAQWKTGVSMCVKKLDVLGAFPFTIKGNQQRITSYTLETLLTVSAPNAAFCIKCRFSVAKIPSHFSNILNSHRRKISTSQRQQKEIVFELS